MKGLDIPSLPQAMAMGGIPSPLPQAKAVSTRIEVNPAASYLPTSIEQIDTSTHTDNAFYVNHSTYCTGFDT
jgi:hypothetical protein